MDFNFLLPSSSGEKINPSSTIVPKYVSTLVSAYCVIVDFNFLLPSSSTTKDKPVSTIVPKYVSTSVSSYCAVVVGRSTTREATKEELI